MFWVLRIEVDMRAGIFKFEDAIEIGGGRGGRIVQDEGHGSIVQR